MDLGKILLEKTFLPISSRKYIKRDALYWEQVNPNVIIRMADGMILV